MITDDYKAQIQLQHDTGLVSAHQAQTGLSPTGAVKFAGDLRKTPQGTTPLNTQPDLGHELWDPLFELGNGDARGI